MMPAAPRQPRRRSLHAQFVRSLLGPLVLAFALAAGTSLWVSYRSSTAQAAEQRILTLQAFSHSLTQPQWDCDKTTAQGIIDTLARMPQVDGVRLHDTCSDTLLHAGRAMAGPPPAGPDHLESPVVYRDPQGRDYTVGQLQISYHPLSARDAAMQSLVPQLGIFLTMLAVVLVGAARVFEHAVGQPLARFRAAILASRPVHAAHAPAPRWLDELGDVTQAYDKLVHELKRLARHDPLTGLANRRALEEHLEHALHQGAPGLHVLLLDLDGFKPVNDRYGHAVGDAVLQGVAQRLRAALRQSDLVARLGGDEFVIVAPDRGAPEALERLLDKVDEAVRAPLVCDEHVLRVHASMGMALFPRDGHSAAALLAHADAAMYAAKQAGTPSGQGPA
ncbi:diguanylate cyclase domain-containing protein [Comamonas flocculans]|uniref:Diguanylate cyclase n=1 Tax=Comamonas flocculans TaxID=2597701 RepID=A0A5B8RVM9_9BURK|nr:diguanylate cyclase [Comamonas flocculans]QEA13571.1 diguanylate cyclase [Comamonas flocculans]